MLKAAVQALVAEIKAAQAKDSAQGVRKRLQKLVLAWLKRTRRLVRAYLTSKQESELPSAKRVGCALNTHSFEVANVSQSLKTTRVDDWGMYTFRRVDV